MTKKKSMIKSVDELMKDTITGITVRGFKSFATEQSIELRPLTILAGANSSGKSSIVQPLLLLKQTVSSYATGSFLLSGPNVKFDRMDQLFTHIPGHAAFDEIKIGLAMRRGHQLDLSYRLRKSARNHKELRLESLSFKHKGRSITLKPWIEHPSNMGKKQYGATMNRFGIWQAEPLFGPMMIPEEGSGEDKEVATDAIFAVINLIRYLTTMIHLPGNRGNAERFYPAAPVRTEFPGTFQEYTASIIAAWQREKNKNLDELNQMLLKLGLTWKVEAKEIDDTKMALLVGRLPNSKQRQARDLVNIADVGFGVSQVLPVLVALLTAKPGQIVYIEEPEIHLHPNAQYAMARILAEAALRGVMVIAETHSTFLLRGIQTLVTKGEIPTDYVKLHWFTRNPKDGTSTVASADLDQMGAWGEWPEDFDEVSFRVEKDFLDARDLKRWPA
jgi:predicted ATPase